MMSNSPNSPLQPGLVDRDFYLTLPNGDLAAHLSNLAIQLAVLGYSDVASRFISRFNKHDKLHSSSNQIRPLWILWRMIGQWPEGEEERVREEIEDERKRKAQEEKEGEDGERKAKQPRLDLDEEVTKPITRHDVEEYVDGVARGWATCWPYPGESPADPDRFKKGPHAQDNLSAKEIRGWQKKIMGNLMDDSDPHARYMLGSPLIHPTAGLVSSLELSSRLEEMDEEPEKGCSPEELLKKIAERVVAEKKLWNFTESQGAWKLMKTGALARYIGVDEKKAEKYIQELEDVIVERLQHGKQEPEDLPISKILSKIEENLKTNPACKEYYEETDRPMPETLLRSPAPASDIEEAEKRLDITLPDDYKEFLAITNGMEQAFSGILTEAPLHTVDKIRWFRDDEDYFSDLSLILPCEDIYYAIARGHAEPWPTVGKCIEIGTEDIDNIWLIPPPNVAAAKAKITEILANEEIGEDVKKKVRMSMEEFAGSVEAFEEVEWCCITWASGGAASMKPYASFKAYLRSVAEDGSKGTEDLVIGDKLICLDLRADSVSKDEEDEDHGEEEGL